MSDTTTREPIRESDEQLRVRCIERYGRWGALMSLVVESSGKSLDDIAAYLGLERR